MDVTPIANELRPKGPTTKVEELSSTFVVDRMRLRIR